MKRAFFFFLLLIQSATVFCQLNMKAGFTSLYTPATNFNSEINAFNTQDDIEPKLQNPIPELHFLNGLQVGLRYTFDKVSTDITWENTLRKRTGYGEDSSGALFQKEYFYNFNALSFNLEAHINPNFHFSVGVGRRNLGIKRAISGSKKRIDISEIPQTHYFLQIKPIFILSPDSKTPLAITPFVLYPLSMTPLDDFQADIGLLNRDPATERFLSFGFSIVYYYGGQLDD